MTQDGEIGGTMGISCMPCCLLAAQEGWWLWRSRRVSQPNAHAAQPLKPGFGHDKTTISLWGNFHHERTFEDFLDTLKTSEIFGVPTGV
jgi:hypothetical protein